MRNLAVLLVLLSTTAPTGAEEPEVGFRPLFDGKTLAGWEGDTKVFRIESGAVVAGSLKEKVAHNDFLCTKEQFGDFELRLQARLIGKGQNAGVQFRSERVPNHFEVSGYQCDMGTANGKPIWGWLYDESRRKKFLVEADAEKLTKAVKADDWNDLMIRCEGPRVQIWVNGLQTVDYTEPDDQVARRGVIGLQIHGGEPAEAAYRNVRIKTL
jgi:3-keto-disaccharide hydrolase